MRKVKLITFGLLLSLLTLSEAQSDCNYFENLEPGKTYYVYNKEYPNWFQGPNQCVWKTQSPTLVKINCTLEEMDQNCSDDYISFQIVGVRTDYYCGSGTFKDQGNNPIIRFSSKRTKKGRFLCELRAEPDEHNCQCGWRNPSYIVGGKETGVNEYPMMAAIIDSRLGKLWNCGATIISNRHVVTAAHCVDRKNINELGILVGEHDIDTGADTSATRLYRTNWCKIHPNYRDIYNDIAVCEIIGTIQYDVRVGPVCLPFQHRYDSFIGSYVTLLGWGLTEIDASKSNVLQEVDVSVISGQTCARQYYPSKQITRSHMCTYSPGKDACQMDSGGPALWQNPSTHKLVLAGITSAGVGCASGKPAIFTRVGDYVDWIMSVTPGVQYCQVE